MPNKHTYNKSERLKSRKRIEVLFEKGEMVKAYPIFIKYMIFESLSEESAVQAGVSVSKRNFKRAVDRNRVKRLMREAYRLQNSELKSYFSSSGQHLSLMIIYSNNVLPDYDLIKQKIALGLSKILTIVSSTDN